MAILFSSFCTATDLNYTYFKRILENNNNIEKYKQGKIKFPSYLNIEISNFIKSLNVPVQVITFGTNPDESLQFQFLTSNLAVLGIQSSNFHHLDKLSSNYVAIIDEITTQTQFVERCKSVMQQFEHQNPCIIYISFMKEFSRKEMQELINKKDKELQQQKYIKDDINSISNALKPADIETAKDKIQRIKCFTQTTNVDKKLANIINTAEQKSIMTIQ